MTTRRMNTTGTVALLTFYSLPHAFGVGKGREHPIFLGNQCSIRCRHAAISSLCSDTTRTWIGFHKRHYPGESGTSGSMAERIMKLYR